MTGPRHPNHRIRRTVIAVAATLWVGGGSELASAGSGFLLRSHSATLLGSAQAGMTAAAEDVTSMVLNPASLGFGAGREFAFDLTGITSSGSFDPDRATTVLGTPITGGNGGDANIPAVVPNFYVAVPLANGVRAGFAVTSFHGLGFEWDQGWVGRYHAVKSELLTLDLIPSVSFKPNDAVSLGVGVDVRYARAKTTTAVDFGTIDVLLAGGAFGGVPAGSDGSLRTKLDDWGVGYTLGVLFEPSTGTRIGASYRSEIRLDVKGRATFDGGGPVGQAIAATTGSFTDTDTNAPLTLPAAVLVGFHQQLTPQWSLMGDVQWTRWSSLEGLDLRFANPLQPEIPTELDWRDSWYIALGARYGVDDKWTLRAGVAYDQTPTRHETSTPAIPDASSVWLGIGASYKMGATTKVDFAYGHIFVKDNPIALQASAPGSTLRGNLAGTIRGSSVDYLAVQFVTTF